MLKSITEMTVDIIKAQLFNQEMSRENIVAALKSIFAALKELKDIEAGKPTYFREPAEKPESKPDKPQRAVRTAEPADFIKGDKIICLECGQGFKQITHTHLKQVHGLSLEEYRRKHGFRSEQPLTAKSLSEKRSKRVQGTGPGADTLKSVRGEHGLR